MPQGAMGISAADSSYTFMLYRYFFIDHAINPGKGLYYVLYGFFPTPYSNGKHQVT